MLISGSSCEKVCSCRLSTNSLVYIGIQRHMYNNISLNSQIMPDNVLDCKKSSTDESSFSELSESLSESSSDWTIYFLWKFSYFISYLFIIPGWAIFPYKKKSTQLCDCFDYWFFSVNAHITYLFMIKVLKMHVSEFHYFIKIKHTFKYHI